MPQVATDHEVITTLLLLDELKGMSARCQSVVIEYLIHKHGGLNKAAKACGTAPSNFVNLRKGKRRASLELLSRYLKTVNPHEPPKGQRGGNDGTRS